MTQILTMARLLNTEARDRARARPVNPRGASAKEEATRTRRVSYRGRCRANGKMDDMARNRRETSDLSEAGSGTARLAAFRECARLNDELARRRARQDPSETVRKWAKSPPLVTADPHTDARVGVRTRRCLAGLFL